MGLRPISEIKADLGIEPNGKVQKYFTERCYQHMDKYVPKDTGALRETVVKETDYIKYNMPFSLLELISFSNISKNPTFIKFSIVS